MPREKDTHHSNEIDRVDDDPGMSRHSSEAQRGPIPESSEDLGSAAGSVQPDGLAEQAQPATEPR